MYVERIISPSGFMFRIMDSMEKDLDDHKIWLMLHGYSSAIAYYDMDLSNFIDSMIMAKRSRYSEDLCPCLIDEDSYYEN